MKLKIPFFKQDTGYTCGPVSLQMAMDFLGKFKGELPLARELHTSEKDGTHHKNMIETSVKEGFYCYANNDSSLEEVERFLKEKLPVIVHFTEPSEDAGHYSVVAGIEKGNVILNDPWNGRNFKISKKEFMERWHGKEGKKIDKKWILVLSKEDFCLGKQYLPKQS